ncbi:phage holin family protein [Burkholderia sp. Ac-20379]|uniref:phage holin family protein n=1 Tax=Burkholderia sp. Ac-20379 TaxID=2703900 RepID=UPI001981BB11|nr:phage holin family protein [Burkholderia sp. Ac-20379]MBN3725620.1 phage holin family protein [Burkholderia sp. Ac-20379]
MHLSYALIALAAHLAVIARVLARRRHGERHRFHVAWAAWAIVAVAGGGGIELLLHAQATGFFQAALAIVLAVVVHLARGDVAHLLRSKDA